MKILGFALTLLLTSSALYASSFNTRSHYWSPDYQLSYQDRITYLKEMTTHFHLLTPGLLAGLVVQTEWQEQTGRDENILWNRFNYSLTALPYKIFQDFKDNHDSSVCFQYDYRQIPEHLQLLALRGCQKWQQYFSLMSRRARLSRLGPLIIRYEIQGQELLWQAHTKTLHLVEKLYPEMYRKSDLPLDELNFLRGWLVSVEMLDTLNFPTRAFLTQTISDLFMPQCFPLGAQHCLVSNLSKKRELFVRSVIALSP